METCLQGLSYFVDSKHSHPQQSLWEFEPEITIKLAQRQARIYENSHHLSRAAPMKKAKKKIGFNKDALQAFLRHPENRPSRAISTRIPAPENSRSAVGRAAF